MKIHIKNGRLIDPKNRIDAVKDLFIAAGKVVGIGQAPADFTANQTIDATGLVVCPGLVDLCARLREPGEEYKATLTSEVQAAIAGGVTSLACPPDTDPVLDVPGLVEMLKQRAKQLNLARVYPLGALTEGLAGKTLTEMNELTAAGCIGFSQANKVVVDTQVLWRAMQYAATFGFTVWLRPQEYYLAQNGVAHDGEVATRLGLKGIPVLAEVLAISNILRISQSTGAKIHLCRISSAEGVEMIRQAKKLGAPITCDVSAHHLHLTEHDIGYFNTQCHLNPPLRSQRDMEALCKGVSDGTIDAICSDHTPVDDDAKLLPFAEAEIGATGLELLLPLTLKWADKQKAKLVDAIARITHIPALIMGINAGHISIDADADLCIFSADTYWKVTPEALHSQGKNTPFIGLELPGKVRYTLVHGQIYQSAK